MEKIIKVIKVNQEQFIKLCQRVEGFIPITEGKGRYNKVLLNKGRKEFISVTPNNWNKWERLQGKNFKSSLFSKTMPMIDPETYIHPIENILNIELEENTKSLTGFKIIFYINGQEPISFDGTKNDYYQLKAIFKDYGI